jgi:hypothetical protein
MSVNNPFLDSFFGSEWLRNLSMRIKTDRKPVDKVKQFEDNTHWHSTALLTEKTWLVPKSYTEVKRQETEIKQLHRYAETLGMGERKTINLEFQQKPQIKRNLFETQVKAASTTFREKERKYILSLQTFDEQRARLKELLYRQFKFCETIGKRE